MILSLLYFKRTYAALIIITLLNATACNNATSNGRAVSADATALSKKYDLDKIKLPAGFTINVYAEVDNARSMALSPNGTLFVSNRNGNKVYAVTDEDRDGVGDKIYVVAKGLDTPNGVAFKDGSLYIATVPAILRIDNIESRLANPPPPQTIYDKYPTEKHHGWKFIAFGPDGKLYVPVGAPCNTCENQNKVFASITSINPDGSGMEYMQAG